MDERRWLSSKDAAAYLGMKLNTFTQKVRDGVLPPGSLSLGPRMVRWLSDDLDRFMRGEKARRREMSVEEIERAIMNIPDRRRRPRAGLPPGHVPDK